MKLEIRIVVPLGEMIMEGDMGAFWDIGCVLFIDLGPGYTGCFLQLKIMA